MANLNEICESMVRDVDDALGAAVVDLSSGLLMAVAHSIPYFTQTYLDAVAAAAVDMFRGKTISAVEKLLSTQRGTDTGHMLQEIQMTTEKTYHFMSVVPGKPNSMVVLITGRKANLGMGWSSVRASLTNVAPLCP